MTAPGMHPDGSHLPATLYSLARSGNQANSDRQDTWVYEQIALRLSDLIDDVYEVSIDRDEKRQLLTLQVQDRNGTTYPARSLSDGTLRFLALAVLALDASAQGVICLEEPENGIHPGRIAAMLELLQDIAVDVTRPVDRTNPLRQVIVNTHSPAVVHLVPLTVCSSQKQNRRSVVTDDFKRPHSDGVRTLGAAKPLLKPDRWHWDTCWPI